MYTNEESIGSNVICIKYIEYFIGVANLQIITIMVLLNLSIF